MVCQSWMLVSPTPGRQVLKLLLNLNLEKLMESLNLQKTLKKLEAFQAGRRTRRPSSRVYGPNWV
jgi:hypothetical protein